MLSVLGLVSVVAMSLGWAAPAPKSNVKDKAKMNRFIDQLMAKMTIEEKAGQLNQFTADMAVTGSSLNPNYKKDLAKGRVGSILNAFSPQVTRELQKIAVEQTRLKIPLIFGFDVIHGHRTIFPIPLGEAASWNLETIEGSARIAAREASADGLHWTFAPMVDIARDPRWGRVSEGAGEDTYLGSKIATARVKGFQGPKVGSTDSVLACVKHFAAYGAPIAGRDYNTVDISERELFETYLPPYRAAVDAGARTAMTSFNELNGVPSTGNEWLLTKLLRDQWKFKGFVVTDYTAIKEMVAHGFAENEKDAARLAINAGSDMDMQSDAYIGYLPELVKSGKVKMSTVDKSVRRILEAKWELGLFEDPYRFSNEERAKKVLMAPEHLAYARDVARRSVVLLKNGNNVLPLKREGTIALIGPHVANKRDQIGNWSAIGRGEDVVSLLEGMTAAAQGKAKILHARGANLLNDGPLYAFFNRHNGGLELDPRSPEEMMDEAVKVARKADVVVMALGETQGMTGEAASRTQIRIPEHQVALLKRIKAETEKPIVLVLFNGRPLALENEIDLVDGLVEGWFLGTQAGHALADVLFGDYNPSGKLPMSFPRNEGQIPIFYSYKNTGRPLDPVEEKFRSKYLDAPNEPLFPFGFGLSYTKFDISEPRLSSNRIRPNQKLKVTVTVKNTGDYDGEETVQLYVRDMVGSVTRPVKLLRGFQKVFLKKGESKELAMELNIEDLKFYDRNMKWIFEPGAFKVMVGPDSSNTKAADFTLLPATKVAGGR